MIMAVFVSAGILFFSLSMYMVRARLKRAACEEASVVGWISGFVAAFFFLVAGLVSMPPSNDLLTRSEEFLVRTCAGAEHCDPSSLLETILKAKDATNLR